MSLLQEKDVVNFGVYCGSGNHRAVAVASVLRFCTINFKFASAPPTTHLHQSLWRSRCHRACERCKPCAERIDLMHRFCYVWDEIEVYS